MFNIKKRRPSFTVVELSIYIGLFGVLTFVLFNIFNGALNFTNLSKKQNETTVRYKINPVELDITFPSKAVVPSNPGSRFPTDPPVVVRPRNIQFCSFQWQQDDCSFSESEPCWVCKCQEVACDSVYGCAGCHNAWVENPLEADECECVDIREEVKDKKDSGEFNVGDHIHYWYDVYDPEIVNVIPLASPGVIISNPIPPFGVNYFTMHPYYQFAWNNNVGWVNLEHVTLNTDLSVLNGEATILSGGDKISFNCSNTKSCNQADYKVSLNKQTNELEGYAWSDNFGWFSFNCKTGGEDGSNICGTSNYKVTIDPATGNWDGYAWNSNVGWISFNCATGGNSQASVCSTSNYKVMDSRTLNGVIKYEFNALADGQSVPITQDYEYNTLRTWNLGAITPTSGNVGTELTISSIAGSNFYDKPLVKLTKTGSPSIFPKTNFTFVSQDFISNGIFDLKNVTPGVYDLQVIDFYGNISSKKKAITIK